MRQHKWLSTTALGAAFVIGCAGPASENVTATDSVVEVTAVDEAAPGLPTPTTSTTSPSATPIQWLDVDNPKVLAGGTPSDQALQTELIPYFAEAAIRGQIVELGPADYLLADSAREAFGGSTARIARETPASIATPVVIQVHEVLGVRSDHPVAVAPGSQLSVWVSGGEVNFTVTTEDAELTGLRPDISHEDEQAIIDSGDEPPSGPEPVPDEPFEFGYSSPEFVSLAEGQEVVAFLRWADWYDPAANDGTSYKDLRLLLSLDYTGAGLFVRELNAQGSLDHPFTHAASATVVPEKDLVTAAGEINGMASRASAPLWLAPEIYETP